MAKKGLKNEIRKERDIKEVIEKDEIQEIKVKPKKKKND